VAKKQSFFTLDSHTLQTSGFPHRGESPFSRACDRDTVTGPKTQCLYSHKFTVLPQKLKEALTEQFELGLGLI
jgi:hypothetical protein